MDQQFNLSSQSENFDQQKQLSSEQSSGAISSPSRRSSLIISRTSCSKKRWSVTSTSSVQSTRSSSSTNSSNSTAKRRSITTIRGFPLKFNAISHDSGENDSDLGSDELRLGAQSAPALLSARVQYNRQSPSLLFKAKQAKTSEETKNPIDDETLYNRDIDDPTRANNNNNLTSKIDKQSTQKQVCQPIVQIKESSSSGSSSNSTDADSDRDRENGLTNVGRNRNSNFNDNYNSDESGSDDPKQELSETSRTSRIVKRRTIRTKQTKRNSRLGEIVISNQQHQKQEEIIDSADLAEEEEEVQGKESTGSQNQLEIWREKDENPEDVNRSSNNINSFFRTRQIGGYKTSSSKTSIKTTSSSKKSSSSSVTTINNKQQQQVQADNNQTNQSSIIKSTTQLSSTSHSSLSKSASTRHIATATIAEQAAASGAVFQVKSSQKAEQLQAESVNMSPNSSTMNPTTNPQHQTTTSTLLPSSINNSPDLSNSSFPFEIERVIPDHGSSCDGSQQIESGESLVTHRESFSTSTSSSLRGSAMQRSGLATASGIAATSQQTSQKIEASSTTSSSTSSSAHLLSSSSSMGSTIKAGVGATGDHRLSAASSTISASSCSTSSSTRASHINEQLSQAVNSSQASFATDQRARLYSTSSRHQHHQFGTSKIQLTGDGLTEPSSNAFQIFVSSPDVRSLAQEIGTDFAKLESCLTRAEITNHHNYHHHQHHNSAQNHLIQSSNLFGHHQKCKLPLASRLFSQAGGALQQPFPQDASIPAIDCATDLYNHPGGPRALPAPPDHLSKSSFSNTEEDKQTSDAISAELNRSNRIRELLNKANNHRFSSPSQNNLNNDTQNATDKQARPINDIDLDKSDNKQDEKTSSAAMNESIERIEQKLSGICKKLDDCSNLKQAIELLEVLIQMIEKAWSVPVCGDDLGFRLCTSLRVSGGLDFILSLILDAHNSAGDGNPSGFLSNKQQLHGNYHSPENNNYQTGNGDMNIDINNGKQSGNSNHRNQLRLSMPNESNNEVSLEVSLRKNNHHDQIINSNLSGDSNLNSPTLSGTRSPPVASHQNNHHPFNNNNNNNYHQTKDSDSEILTSDLGLDSASVESFSYANTTNANNIIEVDNNLNLNHDNEPDQANKSQREDSQKVNDPKIDEHLGAQANTGEQERTNCTLQRDELIFLSARLLSQCLTTDNRDYLVEEGWLEPVVKLSCQLAMIKSGQAHRKLLLGSSKCVLTRQSSTVCSAQLKARLKLKSANESGAKTNSSNNQQQLSSNQHEQQLVETICDNKMENMCTKNAIKPPEDQELPIEEDQQADLLAAIGTEILQHLFKHSEDTCITIISMGGLEAILFGCRSSCVETLRHCAPALSNLALHGGPQAHELMIEHKAHVWLFPLAFNEDDNVQYYACLAIVTLVANQEIEADVLKSSTLNLVEPFVTSHEPRRFAESNTAHIHGQSANWLKRLIPLLSSKREEARNLAAFHLAMEAYVKREQAQSHIFKEIGAIEPLKKLGGSPNAIASKFACQALRLIGETVPHRLSQQVALWTTEDVIQWVCQVGFAKYECQFQDSGVDGDLLLQLDEPMLERDIGITNGITRRRFLRELGQLKRISDYSSLDRSGLCSILGMENLQYAYQMLKFGVTRDNICHLDADSLLEECGIPNTIHRKILTQTIRSLQEKMALQAQAAADQAQDGSQLGNQKTLDVFVSYRRSTGSQLASLLKVHLQLRNFSVFIDVERLEAGKFDNNLLDSIKQARNFILVLSPNALDRCIDDFECKDWVHKEIVAALASDCNIIPIMDNFSFPDPEKLPEDMRSILYYNGVPWIHDYQDACVDKIERFIRGEVNKVNGLAGLNIMANNPNVSMTNSSQQSNCGSLKRYLNQFASPTPSVGGPITPIMNLHHQQQQQQQQYTDSNHPLASATIHYQQ